MHAAFRFRARRLVAELHADARVSNRNGSHVRDNYDISFFEIKGNLFPIADGDDCVSVRPGNSPRNGNGCANRHRFYENGVTEWLIGCAHFIFFREFRPGA